MNFPLTLSDVSLWLAVTTIILLITSELILSSPELSMRVLVNKPRLRLIASVCGLAFLVTVVMRVVVHV
jgi:hypothetical protein